MRKIILLSTVFFLFGITIRAGEVFPTSDAIWNMQLSINFTTPVEIIYSLIGDTIIKNKVYNKMYVLSDTILSLNKAEYVGGFRIQNEQVWFIPRVNEWEYQHPEFLLYDFSKNEGDTVDHGIVSYAWPDSPFFSGEEFLKERKSLITEVYVDEQGRKHLKTDHNGEWIEGLGDKNGLFSSFYVYATDGISRIQNLACFKYQDIIKYINNSECNKCFCMNLYIVDIKTDEKDSPVIIHTHPQTKEIQIEIPAELLPASMDIYNVKGTLISSQGFTESCSSVNCQSFQPGTYIYRISQLGKSLQSGKIIIR